jgi:hypothetical protein
VLPMHFLPCKRVASHTLGVPDRRVVGKSAHDVVKSDLISAARLHKPTE